MARLFWQGVKNDIAALCRPVSIVFIVFVAGVAVVWWAAGLALKRRG